MNTHTDDYSDFQAEATASETWARSPRVIRGVGELPLIPTTVTLISGPLGDARRNADINARVCAEAILLRPRPRGQRAPVFRIVPVGSVVNVNEHVDGAHPLGHLILILILIRHLRADQTALPDHERRRQTIRD
jgi:hypothetical protein